MRILSIGIALLAATCTTVSVPYNPVPETAVEVDTHTGADGDSNTPETPMPDAAFDESTACVEEIIEAEQDYIIARILHSFDENGQKIDERLVDLHPDHHDDVPCYGSSTDFGYSRYTHTWSYDSDGRTVQERYADVGDYAFCGQSTASQNDSTWVFSTSGLLIEEKHRHTKGNTVISSETEYQYNSDGLLSVKSYRQSEGYSSFVERWTYDDTRPQEKESIYENNVGDRFLSTTSWAYSDSGDLLTKIEKKSQALDGNSGFRSVEERIYGENAMVIMIRSDNHAYPLHSNHGPMGADGIYDARLEYTHDESGRILSETSHREANGSLNAVIDHERHWEYDEYGRVIREISDGLYFHFDERQFSYGPFGILIETAFDSEGEFVHELQYTYDASGRETSKSLVDGEGTTTILHQNQWEYDTLNRLSRWQSDTDGDGIWDQERRFHYDCGVEFTKSLGLDTTLQGNNPNTSEL